MKHPGRSAIALAPLACALLVCLLPAPVRTSTPKFFPDDPIWRDVETLDASMVQPSRLSDQYELIENSFLSAGERADSRALNVNTVDEVPDSSWFTNRAGPRAGRLRIPELVRGADTREGPAGGRWTVTARKREGVTPGLTIRDGTGETYWIKFDPKSFPEMASGAEIISTKFFHAFGYHVPENYVTTVRREALALAPDAITPDEDGRPRPMTPRDIDAVLDAAARRSDGSYRVLASRSLRGRPLGPFRYSGTRPDDPNDIYPHEHRRELRGLAVFAAWLNHDEVRGSNSLDTLVVSGGRSIVRHHLLDFGSTLGSGSIEAQSRRAGNEFVWESRPTLLTILTFGFYVRPWIRVPYPDMPAAGRFESAYFRPEAWKPDYPNPAFRNARADDRFWAARILAAFDEQAIGAVVDTARYSDSKVARHVTATLLERRRKILAVWLNGTNPVVDPVLSASGELTFANAAEAAGVAGPAERYAVQWYEFENASGTLAKLGPEASIVEPRTRAPVTPGAHGAEYIAARIRAFSPVHPGWSRPLFVYFRRAAPGWSLVGLEREP